MRIKQMRRSSLISIALIALAGIVWATDYVASSGDSANWGGFDFDGVVFYESEYTHGGNPVYFETESNLYCIGYSGSPWNAWFVEDCGYPDLFFDPIEEDSVGVHFSATSITQTFSPFGSDEPGSGHFTLEESGSTSRSLLRSLSGG
jgi:hypothetical protein